MTGDSSVAHDLHLLEERLLQPAVRKSRDQVAPLLADDFVEFGSSGRVFDKQQILDALEAESPARRSLTDFRARSLAPGVILVTYRSIRAGDSGEPEVHSLRSSVWKLIHGRWQIVFHHGSLASKQSPTR